MWSSLHRRFLMNAGWRILSRLQKFAALTSPNLFASLNTCYRKPYYALPSARIFL